MLTRGRCPRTPIRGRQPLNPAAQTLARLTRHRARRTADGTPRQPLRNTRRNGGGAHVARRLATFAAVGDLARAALCTGTPIAVPPVLGYNPSQHRREL